MAKSNLLVTVGIAAGVAVAGHFGYWWYVTSSMKQTLAGYGAYLQQAHQIALSYEATPTGYPFHTQLAVKNLKMSFSKPVEGATLNGEFAMLGNVTLETVSPLVKGHISMTGRNVPITLAMNDTAGKTHVDMKGTIGEIDSSSAFATVAEQTGPASFSMKDFTLTDTSGFGVKVASAASQVGAGTGSHSVDAGFNDIMLGNAKGTVRIEKIGLKGDWTVPGWSSVSELDNANFKMGKAIWAISGPDGQPLVTTLDGIEIITKNDMHEPFVDSRVKFGFYGLKVAPNLKVSADTPKVINSLACTITSSNIRAAIVKQMQLVQTPGASGEIAVKAFQMLLQGFEKDKLRFDIMECGIDADTVKATLSASIGGTEDGYPDVSADVFASGQAMVEVNAMKGMMLPTDGVSGTDPKEFKASVKTVSGTLVLDGKPVMQLPKLSDLAMMGAAMASSKMAVPGGVPAGAIPAPEVSGTAPAAEAPVKASSSFQPMDIPERH